MNNKFKKNQLGIFLLCSLITACVAAPVEKESVLRSGSISNGSSTEAIKREEEQKYAQLLNELQLKNAHQDAQQAIRRGDHHVLGYQSGRGGLKVPGINVQQNRCKVKQLDGMGDVIFGDNHLRYRVALAQYANRFNLVMLPYCR